EIPGTKWSFVFVGSFGPSIGICAGGPNGGVGWAGGGAGVTASAVSVGGGATEPARERRVCPTREIAPGPSIPPGGRSAARMFCAPVCVAVMFGRICVVADQCRPQSLDDHQLTPFTWIGTTTRPQTEPGAEPGGGGWTSGTPPMPPVRPTGGAAALPVAAPIV